MSAQDEVSIVVKCLRLGAADYLVKPLRTNELLNLWTHMWRRRRMVCISQLLIYILFIHMIIGFPLVLKHLYSMMIWNEYWWPTFPWTLSISIPCCPLFLRKLWDWFDQPTSHFLHLCAVPELSQSACWCKVMAKPPKVFFLGGWGVYY